MRKLFSGFVILLLFVPSLVMAGMFQADVDKIYTKPIMLGEKQGTFNIELPVDSTDGYRWFLVSPEYGYINAVKFTHESVDVENSKWGGVDKFKFTAKKEFKDVPQKIVLRFECFRPFEKDVKVISKYITILSAG
jgi:predicted secreted protein